MPCSCNQEELEPWQRPLLSKRQARRLDNKGRIQGKWLNGELYNPDGNSINGGHLLTGGGEVQGYIGGVGFTYSEKVKTTRGRSWEPTFDAAETHYPHPWARSFTGTSRVGPGWDDASRLDGGEIEVLIDGTRCIQLDSGDWVTAEGLPCPEIER